MAEITPIKLISDNAVKSATEGGADDPLKRGDMVDAIAGVIMGVEPPFTLGIYGTWGSGKTHFMRQVKQKLDQSSETPQPITVWYEAWLHQNDVNPELSMLQCASEALEEKSEDKAWSTTVSATLDSLEFTLGIPGVLAVKRPSNAAKNATKSATADSANQEIADNKRPTNLQSSFEKALDVLSGKDPKSKQVETHKIVFFIDDLDRCRPEAVIDMLERIKLFMWHDQCVFVLGADQSAIQKAIKATKYPGPESEGIEERYLEKIVNFPFRLPPVKGETSKDFFRNKILDAETPEVNEDNRDDIINLFASACDGVGASLRVWILLVNTFTLGGFMAQRLIDANGTNNYNACVMAVLAALQVLHPSAFEDLCKGYEEREGKFRSFFTDESEDWKSLLGTRLDDSPALIDVHRRAIEFEIGANTDFVSYVEFLVSQSEKTESLGMDYWRWYEKDPAPDKSSDKGTFMETIYWIKENVLVGPVQGKTKVLIDDYEWRILKREENRALLLSEYILGSGPLDNRELANNEGYRFDWMKSGLRAHLNSPGWLRLYLPELSASDSVKRAVDDSEETGLFLLSGKQAQTEEFFSSNEERSAQKLTNKSDFWWWLRSPGRDAGSTAFVSLGGSVYADGYYVRDDGGGVRPAFWLNL